MATHDRSRNPIESSSDHVKSTPLAAGSASHALDEFKDALSKGLEDYGTYRTEVILPSTWFPSRDCSTAMSDR